MKRYDFGSSFDDCDHLIMRPDGKWVSFEDAQAAVLAEREACAHAAAEKGKWIIALLKEVAKDEREACALLAEGMTLRLSCSQRAEGFNAACDAIATAIRAGSPKPHDVLGSDEQRDKNAAPEK